MTSAAACHNINPGQCNAKPGRGHNQLHRENAIDFAHEAMPHDSVMDTCQFLRRAELTLGQCWDKTSACEEVWVRTM